MIEKNIITSCIKVNKKIPIKSENIKKLIFHPKLQEQQDLHVSFFPGKPESLSKIINCQNMFMTNIEDVLALANVREEGLNPPDIINRINSLPIRQIYKDIFFVLRFYQNTKTGQLNVSNKTLASDLGICEETVKRRLKWLDDNLCGMFSRYYFGEPLANITHRNIFIEWDFVFDYFSWGWDHVLSSFNNRIQKVLPPTREGIKYILDKRSSSFLFSSSYYTEFSFLTRFARSKEKFGRGLGEEDFSVGESIVDRGDKFYQEKMAELTKEVNEVDNPFVSDDLEISESTLETLSRSQMTAIADDEEPEVEEEPFVHHTHSELMSRLDSIREPRKDPPPRKFSRSLLKEDYPVEWEYCRLVRGWDPKDYEWMRPDFVRDMVIADSFFVWFRSMAEVAMRSRWERQQERESANLRQVQPEPELPPILPPKRTRSPYSSQYVNPNVNPEYKHMSITHRANQFLQDLNSLFDGKYSFQGKHANKLKSFMDIIDEHKGLYHEWITASMWAIPTDRLYLNNILSTKWAKYRYDQWVEAGKPKDRHFRGNANWRSIQILKAQQNGHTKRTYKKRKNKSVMDEINEAREKFIERRRKRSETML